MELFAETVRDDDAPRTRVTIIRGRFPLFRVREEGERAYALGFAIEFIRVQVIPLSLGRFPALVRRAGLDGSEVDELLPVLDLADRPPAVDRSPLATLESASRDVL